MLTILPSTEAATQNFSILGLDDLECLPVLVAYGGMEAYVAFAPDAPRARLLFIPAVPSSNLSFILASFVFKYTSQIHTGAIVWMANRHRPISRNFSLSLNQSSGYLILLDGDGSLAWSSNISSVPNGTVFMDLITNPYDVLNNIVPIATLLHSDSANYRVWKSSNYPTHALSPPQYFQPNMSLVSWASMSDPSNGLYRLVMEVGGLALYYDGYPHTPLPYWVWSFYGRTDRFGITHACKNLTKPFLSPHSVLYLQFSRETSQEGLQSSDLCVNNAISSAKFDNSAIKGLGDAIVIPSLQYDGNLIANSIDLPWTNVYDLFVTIDVFFQTSVGHMGSAPPHQTANVPTILMVLSHQRSPQTMHRAAR
ncbi:hypothetical protein L7F22_060040 [Adiantum nelumboides]|nr:hypothetical protein [Adiantum nelumboides]